MTAETIRAAQWRDGGIPWQAGDSLDPWNHVEAAMGLDVTGHRAEAEAAYRWLAANQNPDGSWYAEYRQGEVVDRARDTNFTAYIAVGLAHHTLLHGDALVRELWPAVERAMAFVLSQQRPGGEVPWRLGAEPRFLVAGCASIHHALRHASALATRLGHAFPDWLAAADRLGDALRERRHVFTAKRHSMDWYYPVLCSVVTGAAVAETLTRQWDRFVVPGLGVRCVDHEPWVTGGETAELALTLATRGHGDRASALLADIERLRHPDGSYWTGYQFEDKAFWPEERTTWTAGAVLLAHAAVAGDAATRRIFGELAAKDP